MKKLITYFIIILSSLKAFAQSHPEISEIYIEAQGNNRYEAKIKAHEEGMQRALLMLADKLGIKSTEIASIPYTELNLIFSIAATKNERSSEDSYSATVTYQYSRYNLNKVIYEYGTPTVRKLFYEYLIIPVFKQKSIINIWNPSDEWTRQWTKNRVILDNYKIFYPNNTPLITPKNIYHLQIDDFLNIFPNKLFRKVLIVTGEIFTHTYSGDSYLTVYYDILEQKSKQTIKKDYTLERIESIPLRIKEVIESTLREFGNQQFAHELLKVNDLDNAEQAYKTRTILMNAEVFDEDELTAIKQKLSKIKEIDHFTLKKEYEKKYKLIIFTKADDFSFARALYLNGLSFRIYNNLYNLIDVKNGM